uniref:Transposase n=1 Tax=uncultured bacterium CSLF43 TaxID=1091575 RepID=G4WW17_9BACT|nr:transposase [uncultured bacterium CSLF43]
MTDLLNDWEYLDKKIDSLGRHIEAELAGKEDVIGRLCAIPGVDRITAWTIVAEIGLDMSEFPDAAHLASWAGLCPGNNESAGKRLGGRTRKGDRYLRRALVQVAWAIAHTKDGNFLNATFFRIARRRGLKKAALAVAHRVLLIAYYILRDGTEYRELGGDYYDRLHPERTMKRLVARLKHLGMQVEVHPERELGTAAPRPPVAPVRPQPSATQSSPAEPSVASSGQPAIEPARKRGRPRKTSPPVTEPAPACRRCARWGIPCIHVKRHFPEPPQGASAPESTG